MSANERQVGGDHYRKQGIQHWDYILANDIPYMEAQIIKYVSRWRKKGGVQDLEKARHFLDKLIEYEVNKRQLDYLHYRNPEGRPVCGASNVVTTDRVKDVKCPVCKLVINPVTKPEESTDASK